MDKLINAICFNITYNVHIRTDPTNVADEEYCAVPEDVYKLQGLPIIEL
jgi:hypothetical protein